MIDTAQQQGKRRKLVKDLGIQYPYNKCVLQAMEQVPRHFFVAPGLDHLAYLDKPLPIAAGQTISQPSTVALQSHLLGEIKGCKVLEIGTGCGYQTAVLAAMGAEVYTMERQRELCRFANERLKMLGYTGVSLFLGDGYKGLARFAPFKGIIVTCGAEQIPENLLLQLEIGGKMVIPVGEYNKEQEMFVISRKSDTEFEKTPAGKCSFVPMLEGIIK